MEIRVVTEPQQGASYQALLKVARAAEELGYGGFFCSDHYLWDPYLKVGSPPTRPGPTDAWITLAGLSRETQRIRLGSLVSPATFRRPGVLAIQVAQVDAMSGGRVDLGLGSGWYLPEHVAYGIPFPEDRHAHLEEQLAIITGLWGREAGEVFDYAGVHYRLESAPPIMKPGQRTPPIIIGGTGPKRTPRLAARYAADFNVPYNDVVESGRLFARVDEACDEIGRDPRTLVHSVAQVLCCGRDQPEVHRRAAAIRWTVPELRQIGLAGTPAEVVDRLGRFAEIGTERVYLQVLDLTDIGHLELTAHEVVRQLKLP